MGSWSTGWNTSATTSTGHGDAMPHVIVNCADDVMKVLHYDGESVFVAKRPAELCRLRSSPLSTWLMVYRGVRASRRSNIANSFAASAFSPVRWYTCASR